MSDPVDLPPTDEPTILTVLRLDHGQGMHSDPHPRNQHCPACFAPADVPTTDRTRINMMQRHRRIR